MSNNKQIMKLYTEEQLERAIDLAKRNVSKNRIVESLIPIELPSDEDKNLFYQKQVMNPYPSEEYAYTAYEKGFMEGAKWMRDKIGGNNEQQ